MAMEHTQSEQPYQELIRDMFKKSRLLELVPVPMQRDALEAAELLLTQEIGAWIACELPGEELKSAMATGSIVDAAKESIPDFQEKLEQKIEDFFDRFLASLNEVYASVPALKHSNV